MSDDGVHSDHTSSSSSSTDESDDSAPVETLVAGRAKRTAAGNRLSSLIQKEVDEDDDIGLLFAEDEEEVDNEFQEEEDADSDVQLDSSSDDDDDQGPNTVARDLEGEKEIESQDRAERRKKRKALEIFKRPQPPLKKVKYDPTTTPALSATPPPRPKKKSERLSWLPTTEDGATRSSSRKQTVQNKEVVHQRMQESEIRRRRQVAAMEQASKRKQASKPKAMTQADRMAEAARTEKKNEKSLTKWQENENKRVMEQKERLAALHNRQLKGPVITWWSGPAKWVNGVCVKVGAKKVYELEEEPTPPKVEALGGDRPSVPTIALEAAPEPIESSHTLSPAGIPSPSVPPVDPDPPGIIEDQPQSQPNPLNQTTLPTQTMLSTGLGDQRGGSEFMGTAISTESPMNEVFQTHPTLSAFSSQVPSTMKPWAPSQLPSPPITEIITKNIVALKGIDLTVPPEARIPQLRDHVLLLKAPTNSKKSRIHSQRDTSSVPHSVTSQSQTNGNGGKAANLPPRIACVITGRPAKYRDPKTGLAYHNSLAYKEIQKLVEGSPAWSTTHECYTGAVGVAARGVPERFLSSG
ncbi:hypothetical protein MMC25_001033 [Agyrium rufum]|nr:hypothetical protein [Agyrium rufum]